MPTAVQGSAVSSARPQLWRITDRRTFQALRQQGRRARRGPLTVTWLPPEVARRPPRPARASRWARPPAVRCVRNRVRRRLRAVLRQLATEGRLPAGSYLLGGSASLATMPWTELVELVAATIAEAQR